MKLSELTASSLDRPRTHANGTRPSARNVETNTGPNGAACRSLSSPGASPGTATAADGTVANLPTLSAQHAAALEARGLDLETASRYGLTTAPGKFAGKDGLVIPFVREGRVINHKYRGPGKQFAQDAGAVRSFWNEDCLRDETLAAEPLIVTEGEFDALAAIQSGHLRTVSVPDGAGTNLDFIADLMPLLNRAPRIILAGDGDTPGQKLNAELARRFGAARCAWLDYPDGTKDLNEVLLKGGEQGVASLVKGAKPYPIKGVYRLSDFPEQGDLELFDTGWLNLNAHLKLWLPEFVVITGVPSHGKSKFAIQLLCQMNERHGHKSAIASFEVPVKPHVRGEMRMFYDGPAVDADEWIEDNFYFIGSDPRDLEEEIEIGWLIDKASDAVIRYGIKWLLIDPWNQLDHARGRMSLVEYQERAIRDLRRFARSYGCGVIVVAHPTKDVKGKDGKIRVPNLYDIDGSAHWFNAPDHGIVVDRPDVAAPDVNVIIKKSRFRMSGCPGEAMLRFDVKTGRYRPLFDTDAESSDG